MNKTCKQGLKTKQTSPSHSAYSNSLGNKF